MIKRRHCPFNKLIRILDHQVRINKFAYDEVALDPNRLVTRALYGTDYDPDSVKFIYRPPMLTAE